MKRTILLLTFVVTVSCMHAQRMLTLEECRNLAIQNNKELQISGEKIKMADNEKKAAFTKYFPQLSANGAYMWNQKDINLLDMGALSSSLSHLRLIQFHLDRKTIGLGSDSLIDHSGHITIHLTEQIHISVRQFLLIHQRYDLPIGLVSLINQVLQL